ncbi:MAG: tol-pal system protein YbgF [Desulfobacterales bacterium]|nr:tol-pal system protein YbgF [Desulfobacterales bacterium]
MALLLSACSITGGKQPVARMESIEALQENMARKDEYILNLETKLQTLEQQVIMLEKENKACLSTDFKTAEPGRIYQKARNLLLEENFIQAGQLFTALATRFPRHSLADNALYWQGECYYSLGQYQKAIDVFKRLIKSYPKAEKVPAALLKTGYSYLSLGDANRAGHFLKQVIKRYPFSPVSEKAQEKLSLID